MRKKVLLFYNPSAGQSTGKTKLHSILQVLSENGCLVSALPIEPECGLTSNSVLDELLEEGGNTGYDCIACVGGDGTLNHLVNSMLERGITCPIGYLPSGSTNDFSKNIYGRELRDEEICLGIAKGFPYPYDIGLLEGRAFNYVAAFGAFTEVSYSTQQNVKNVLGYGAYILSVLANLPEDVYYRKHVRITCGEEVREGDYVFGAVTNTLSIAGVRSPLLERANLSDGVFEAILIRAPKDLMSVGDIVDALSSGTPHPEVEILRGERFLLESDEELDWTADGEYGGSWTRTSIEVLHHGMRIMVRREGDE